MIIVEERLEEIFDHIPEIEGFKPTFGFGTRKDLISFLKLRGSGSKPYPLIWLLTPYEEDHLNGSKTVRSERMDFILAAQTNSTMINKDRLKKSFDKLLFPLCKRFKEVLRKASTISSSSDYKITKHYNFGSEELSEVTDIWDVIKIGVLDVTVNSKCLQTMIINE